MASSSDIEMVVPSDEEPKKDKARRKEKKLKGKTKKQRSSSSSSSASSDSGSDNSTKNKPGPSRLQRKSDSLYLELTSEESKYRKKKYADINILDKKLNCTSCNKNLKSYVAEGRDVFSHPVLRVLLCKECCHFYGDGNFSLDEDGSDRYCRWCGQGGVLYCCSTCSCAFCKPCMKRNLKRSVMDDVKKEDWKCFLCDSKPLWDVRALCSAAQEYSNETKKKHLHNNRSKLQELCIQRSGEKTSARTLRLKQRKRTFRSNSEESEEDKSSKNTKKSSKHTKASTSRRDSKIETSSESSAETVVVSLDEEEISRKKKKPSKYQRSSGAVKTSKRKSSHKKKETSSEDGDNSASDDSDESREMPRKKQKKANKKVEDSDSESEKVSKRKVTKKKVAKSESDNDKPSKKKGNKNSKKDSDSDTESEDSRVKSGKKSVSRNLFSKKKPIAESGRRSSNKSSRKDDSDLEDRNSKTKRKSSRQTIDVSSSEPEVSKKSGRKDEESEPENRGSRTRKSAKNKDGTDSDLKISSKKLKKKGNKFSVLRVDRKSAKKACLWIQEACDDIFKIVELASSRSNDLCVKGVNVTNMTKVEKVAKVVDSLEMIVSLSIRNLSLAKENLKLAYKRWLKKEESKQAAAAKSDDSSESIEAASKNRKSKLKGSSQEPPNKKSSEKKNEMNVDNSKESSADKHMIETQVEEENMEPVVEDKDESGPSLKKSSLSTNNDVKFASIKIKSVSAINKEIDEKKESVNDDEDDDIILVDSPEKQVDNDEDKLKRKKSEDSTAVEKDDKNNEKDITTSGDEVTVVENISDEHNKQNLLQPPARKEKTLVNGECEKMEVDKREDSQEDRETNTNNTEKHMEGEGAICDKDKEKDSCGSEVSSEKAKPSETIGNDGKLIESTAAKEHDEDEPSNVVVVEIEVIESIKTAAKKDDVDKPSDIEVVERDTTEALNGLDKPDISSNKNDNDICVEKDKSTKNAGDNECTELSKSKEKNIEGESGAEKGEENEEDESNARKENKDNKRKKNVETEENADVQKSAGKEHKKISKNNEEEDIETKLKLVAESYKERGDIDSKKNEGEEGKESCTERTYEEMDEIEKILDRLERSDSDKEPAEDVATADPVAEAEDSVDMFPDDNTSEVPALKEMENDKHAETETVGEENNVQTNEKGMKKAEEKTESSSKGNASPKYTEDALQAKMALFQDSSDDEDSETKTRKNRKRKRTVHKNRRESDKDKKENEKKTKKCTKKGESVDSFSSDVADDSESDAEDENKPKLKKICLNEDNQMQISSEKILEEENNLETEIVSEEKVISESEKVSKDKTSVDDKKDPENIEKHGDDEKETEPSRSGDDDDDDEKIAEIKSERDELKSLLDLKNLKKGSKGKSDNNSSTQTQKKLNASKKEGKKKADKATLEDLNNMSDSDENMTASSGNEFQKIPDLEASFKELHDKLEKKRMEMAKSALLQSTSSDSGSDSLDEEKGKSRKKKKKAKEGSKVKEERTSDVEVKKEEDTDEDEDDEDTTTKKKKKNWRTDKLLRGKLVDTSSSEEERRWKVKKEKELKKEAMKDRKKSSNRLAGSNSDSDVLPLESSDSSSSNSDFIFKPSWKRKNISNSRSDEEKSSSSTEKKKSKSKRRRIKKMSDSDSDGSDDHNTSKGDTPGKGRKNIRRVMKDDLVAEATRKAAKEEEERRKRIAEKQELYNKLYNELQENAGNVEKLILDFDPETKEELVKVDEKLVQKMKPHQAKGIKFMWDACFESLKLAKSSKGSGCILAHCMGLGKTFQVVGLVNTLFSIEETNVKTVLIVCPLSTVLNWVNEFNMWLKDQEHELEVYELTRYKKNFERAHQLKEWHENGGVMVIGYDMFRNLSNISTKRARKSAIEAFNKALVDPGPDLVVCDEGHLLKNEDTALSKAMRKIRTLRRIVLTGTPLQNNLKEYHCMVQFVKPNLLGTRKEFLNRFVNPITNGQFEDSTTHDVKIMKRRAHVLHKMLEGSVQRFDYSVLMPFLPPKHEYVISIRLTDLQAKLYRHFLDHEARGGSGEITKGKGAKLFGDFQALQRVWTHPRVLLMNAEKNELLAEKREWMKSESEGSLKDFIDDSDTSDESSVSGDGSNSNASNNGNKEEVVNKWKSSTRGGKKRAQEENGEEEVEESEKEEEAPKEWWRSYLSGNELDDVKESGKLMLLFSILQESEKIGDKVLVFSQSLYSLDLIEYFLERIDEATQKGESLENLCNLKGSWAFGLDYFRLDGSTSSENRNSFYKSFNKEDNLRARLFLISTRAGGLGINLFAANRVIIFDASWNPSHDVQSIFRVYRFGQKKPCYIYRFLALGTMEEKIYDRQVAKLSLSCRVVDEQQIERHYNFADLNELYTFDPQQKAKRPTPILPKDRLLAELLKEHENIIETYHEHDSLLENKEEEELNEEERKAAWEDFENEKKGVVLQNIDFTADFNAVPNINPALIRAKLKRDNPHFSEEMIQQQLGALIKTVYEYTSRYNGQILPQTIPPQLAQFVSYYQTQQRAQKQAQQQVQPQPQSVPFQPQQLQMMPTFQSVNYDYMQQQMLRHQQLRQHQATDINPALYSKQAKKPRSRNQNVTNPFTGAPPAHISSAANPTNPMVARQMATDQMLLAPLANPLQNKPKQRIVLDTIDVE